MAIQCHSRTLFWCPRKPRKSTFSITSLSFDASSPRNPRNPHKSYIAAETTVIALHCCRWQYRSFFIQIFVVGSENTCILKQAAKWLFKVIQGHWFGINRKRVCNFSLVINSNLGPILPRFRDFAGFCWEDRPHPYSTRIFGYSLGLDCRCCGPEVRRKTLS